MLVIMREIKDTELSAYTETPDEVRARIKEFANEHKLLLADPHAIEAHIAHYLAMGHCPCVLSRNKCPCSEALGDIERSGQCACGIFVSSQWIDKLREK